MATLVVVNAVVDGVEITENAANGGGDDFPNNGTTMVVFRNESGGAITVTADDIGTATPTGAQAFDPDMDIVVGAGEVHVAGPFPLGRFGTSVGLTYSGVTTFFVSPFNVV